MSIIISILLCFHLMSEVLTTYSRYNYAAHSQQMRGANVANYFGIASRAFITLYAFCVSYQIENGKVDVYEYLACTSIAFVFGAIFSHQISKLQIKNIENNFIYSVLNSKISKNVKEVNIIDINNFVSIFIGIQFVSLALAFSLCMLFPKYRLSIISFTPILNMLGTLTTVVFVEPKLAKSVDQDCTQGFQAAKIFSRARFISFSFGFISIWAGIVVIYIN